ncbi:hypothetical protein NDU88_000246 [Pleurodeles waltl]|uniref:Uncharacterized protein n=1 Tax=Pleurodeles waltl TaxID=8319 RepID=A0AAV7Q0N7_PLEWA|nr:hypothetical protein NDU88_000246 [Pleurodeles waltl]
MATGDTPPPAAATTEEGPGGRAPAPRPDGAQEQAGSRGVEESSPGRSRNFEIEGPLEPAVGVPDPGGGGAWAVAVRGSLPSQWREQGGELAVRNRRPGPSRCRQMMLPQGPGGSKRD